MLPIILILLVIAGCKKDKTKALVPDITSGLVVNIPLENGVAYDSVSGTTGTIYRATPWVNRHNTHGASLTFPSSDSAYIDFGDLANASFTNNIFTITCWVYVLDTTQTIAVLSKRGTTGPFEYSLDNHFNHNIFNLDNWTESGSTSPYGTDPLKASVGITPNTWQHIAYVADGGNLKVYVNGKLQSNTDAYNSGASLSHTSGHLVIGNGGGYGRNYYFNGAISDIRMYNKALDDVTIGYLYSL